MLIQHIKASTSYLQNKMQIESNAYWNVAFMFILAAAAFMIPAESFA
ncbi:MAG: hypothetical protein K0R98_1477, partial [Rickettsiaceae bacterium]|nr:hypothetical protein [Rickettsiaceae bacterium]